VHLTLHLTANCNFRCKYCYAGTKHDEAMSLETAQKAIEMSLADSKLKNRWQSLGIVFFGGEPMLYKKLIQEIVEYCHGIEQTTGQQFHYKMTTNGSLIDEQFLTHPLTSEIFIALSHDGVVQAHNLNRIDATGTGTFERLVPIVSLLLKYKPYAPVMQVVTPSTLKYYADSVKFYYAQGFKYIISTLNYREEWTEQDFFLLQKQYLLLTDWYAALITKEHKFYFSPFDVKIASHIFSNGCNIERCELGQHQISVAPDGNLYPCVQFVKAGSASKYCIGNVTTGVDEQRRQKLFIENASEKDSCEQCAVKSRCNHYCGCINRATTGSINAVSPYLCAHERIVIPIADKLAEKLYKNRNALFMQKQYNRLYPLLSLVEDKTS